MVDAHAVAIDVALDRASGRRRLSGDVPAVRALFPRRLGGGLPDAGAASSASF